MSKKHSASLEMLSYLKSYAAKRAERKIGDTDMIRQSYKDMSYSERVERLEKKCARIEAQRMSELLELADEIAPLSDNDLEFHPKQAA